MSVRNFIPEIWVPRIMSKFRKSYVYASVCNQDYEGEIRDFGDTVRINGVGPVTIRDYDPTQDLVDEQLQDESQVLHIDQKKYYNFLVDDVDAAQANVNLLAAGMEEAANGLADAVDQYLASLWPQAGTITHSTSINSVNILAFLLTLGQALSEKNVPRAGRYIIVPPWVSNKLVLAKLLIPGQTTGDQDFANGFIGRVAGFDVLESNNVPEDNGTYYLQAGTRKAVSFAGQLVKTEAYRQEKGFKDGVKGLKVYGAKVTYPDALAIGVVTQAAEP